MTMDLRETLAKCEDPTIGWSLQFWVTIADPITQHVFFACPATGACSWDPPIGAFLLPRQADGEWWELADKTRENRSYYYNTLSGQTQWTRPSGDAFVIPLGLIQRNALPARATPKSSHLSRTFDHRDTPTKHSFSQDGSHLDQSTALKSKPSLNSILSDPSFDPHSLSPPPKLRPGPRPPPSPRSPSESSIQDPTTPSRQSKASKVKIPSPLSYMKNDPIKARSQTRPPIPTVPKPRFIPRFSKPRIAQHGLASRISGQLGTVEEGSATEGDADGETEIDGDLSDTADSGTGSWWGRRKPKGSGVFSLASPSSAKTMRRTFTTDTDDASSTVGGSEDTHQNATMVGGVLSQAALDYSKLDDLRAGPIRVASVRTKNLSTGLHYTLPSDISTEIHKFATENFARGYFATKRAGMLRVKLPLERILEWQKSPLTAPILVLDKRAAKDAVLSFKIIQHAMGEREKAVDGIHSRTSLSPAKSVSPNKSPSPQKTTTNSGEDDSQKIVVLEEIRWMIGVAVASRELRDEVFCQLVKQLNRNPKHNCIVLGFQLFCVLSNAFCPTTNFEFFVLSFLRQHCNYPNPNVATMAKYCLSKLDSAIAHGKQSRKLSIAEIEQASDAAFHPAIFGETISRVMEIQDRSYPGTKIPMILSFLADAIVSLGGLRTEGIWRIPGDGEAVKDMKARINRGHYQLQSIVDPHVATSLFKLWLRELESPVIPSDMYNDALQAAQSITKCIEIVKSICPQHRRVLIFVISFLQSFLKEDVVKVTKMTGPNLALIFAPNLLRTTSTSLTTVFTNSSFETKFVLNLLEHLDTTAVHVGYVPIHGQGHWSGTE